ncbi:hypothetical protein [Nitrobacter sp. JJSN]|uniref:hypothetical protein n=1 Tax=Nitrobacter sp. JJSN TaxID=3453033 RepID=UPI003F76C975
MQASLGAVRAQTDAQGLYLLENVTPGEAVLVIDGRQARARRAYPIRSTTACTGRGCGRTRDTPWRCRG